jgi:hypothetical protein
LVSALAETNRQHYVWFRCDHESIAALVDNSENSVF